MIRTSTAIAPCPSGSTRSGFTGATQIAENPPGTSSARAPCRLAMPQRSRTPVACACKRVVAVGDAIAIRSTAFFTMSFDHRVVDGLLGGMFLDQVVKNLQGIDPALKI